MSVVDVKGIGRFSKEGMNKFMRDHVFFFCKEFLNFFIRYSIFTPFFKYYNLLNRIIKQNFYSIISFRTKRFEYEIMNKSKRKRLNKRIKIRVTNKT